MKKIFLLAFVFAAFSMVAVSQSTEPTTPTPIEDATPDTGGPIMSLESNTVDYGTMKQHGEPLRKVSFTNTGTEPLVIKNARGSCGCTVPTWPKEPVLPGASADIEIRYATNRLGKINKTVKITTNEGGDPHVIKVVGNILKPEDDKSVPASAPSILSGGDN
ncbi:MAG: hypothetical protein ACI86M_003082 [Saprospiraceae bacterium]|jgi:hypothetical protein